MADDAEQACSGGSGKFFAGAMDTAFWDHNDQSVSSVVTGWNSTLCLDNIIHP